MKKILAVALMVTSLGATASPRFCLFNWAKSQGADPMMHASGLNDNWGANATFKQHGEGLTVGYGVYFTPTKFTHDSLKNEGPWHCHCTFNKSQIDKDGYEKVTGECGKW